MNPANCIFCKIVEGEMEATRLYEDEHVVAFADIHPVAPTHVLIIPRKHIPGPASVAPEDRELVGHMMHVSGKVAESQGITSYRLVANEGADAGQSVFHLHVHLVGGESLGWPPFPSP